MCYLNINGCYLSAICFHMSLKIITMLKKCNISLRNNWILTQNKLQILDLQNYFLVYLEDFLYIDAERYRHYEG